MPDTAAAQVLEAENAFARTMAERDVEAFAQFVSNEAVFFGDTAIHRGRAEVVRAWSPYFADEEAPFSWAPEVIEVLESGDLAHSSGPVFDQRGRLVGYFYSVWRLEPDGRWRVVFDRGGPVPADR